MLQCGLPEADLGASFSNPIKPAVNAPSNNGVFDQVDKFLDS
jgi:hypothetical protein